MFRPVISTLVAVLLGSAASAGVVEVHMLNRSGEDRMVFEPAFVQAAPGDTIRFVPSDKGHNAESLDGMIPEGASAFGGKINEAFDVTLDTEGVYAVMCKPHYAMGMVMTIAVGDAAAAPEGLLEGCVPKKAKERFEAQLSHL
ncbi:pseudoazurin [Celeribacter indicus]|uniref:Pseudoazurin n=1 Tax=Celeribacter indicus TaxID=1208324 RepID=A0A0B5DX02_9RHOB|nr:pseudoazurin [Celeribacter indicus]AJE45635.1 pseudoazurin [Celeribacter indicus]SDW84030.1 pseudoazurin [Celeribacter indicus]